MQFKLILALVFALIVALFAIQNAQTVDIQFLMFVLPNAPVAGVIIAMLAAGVLLGFLFSAPGAVGKGLKIRELESQLKRKTEELTKVTEDLQKAQDAAAALRVQLQQLKEKETIEPPAASSQAPAN
jgi:uncharacterized integral membrane protein